MIPLPSEARRARAGARAAEADGRRRPKPRRDARQRGPLAGGLALSAILHLLVLAIWTPAIPVAPPATRRVGGAGSIGGADAAPMRAVAIRPVTHSAPELAPGNDPLGWRPEPDAGLRQPDPGTVQADRATGDHRTDRASAADRLAPGRRDPRLWTLPPDLPSAGAARLERARDRVAGRVEEILDSVLPAEAAARRAVDWTLTDAAGNRWGITRDSIYVGGRARPRNVELPGEFDWARQLSEWNLLALQVENARARERLDVRVRALRERKDRERGGGGGSR